jgi:hypothetical protein
MHVDDYEWKRSKFHGQRSNVDIIREKQREYEFRCKPRPKGDTRSKHGKA